MSNELTPQEAANIRRAVTLLNNTMTKIRLRIPEAQYYLEDGINFNVMSGPTHAGVDQRPQYDNVMISETINHSDCGGW